MHLFSGVAGYGLHCLFSDKDYKENPMLEDISLRCLPTPMFTFSYAQCIAALPIVFVLCPKDFFSPLETSQVTTSSWVTEPLLKHHIPNSVSRRGARHPLNSTLGLMDSVRDN